MNLVNPLDYQLYIFEFFVIDLSFSRYDQKTHASKAVLCDQVKDLTYLRYKISKNGLFLKETRFLMALQEYEYDLAL